MAKRFVQRFPYIAKYKTDAQLAGVVALMLEPRHGLVLYIPDIAELSDPRNELYIGQTCSPAESDIEIFSGSVNISNNADPTLTGG